jgi:hypothetical protein
MSCADKPVATSESGAPATASWTTACHCGRVQVKLPSKPSKLKECLCSVCFKYGSLWAYFLRRDVEIITTPGTTIQAYIRDDSDGDISFNRCGHCGCMTQ